MERCADLEDHVGRVGDPATERETESRIRQLFIDAGARGFLHAREIGVQNGPEVCVDADEGVVLASVFKIAVAVAFAREVAGGRLIETEQTTVSQRFRLGGIGTAGCDDDVVMTWRDLAVFMLTMSDNAATDVIYHRLGKETVDRVLADLGLTQTRIIGGCDALFSSMADDLKVRLDDDAIDAKLAEVPAEQVRAMAALDPARTTASTPREVTQLLNAIWTDTAAPGDACDTVRKIMGRQIWPHRLSSGFDDDVHVAGKTGTLPSIRNEAGVVTYPDGRQFAVGVFTTAESLADRQPAIDRSIGFAARSAVDHLRT